MRFKIVILKEVCNLADKKSSSAGIDLKICDGPFISQLRGGTTTALPIGDIRSERGGGSRTMLVGTRPSTRRKPTLTSQTITTTEGMLTAQCPLSKLTSIKFIMAESHFKGISVSNINFKVL